jgi:predicted amidohydrolase
MKIALCQMNSNDDPAQNLQVLLGMLDEAASGGATFVLTPEVLNCMSFDRKHQNDVLELEENDASLAALQTKAAELGIWLLIGSLALKTGDPDNRFANRSFLIDPQGSIVSKYDKIHMFDVNLSETESYRESAGYRPGDRAVTAAFQDTILGMAICYDVRFPHLFRQLAQNGATVITVPAAFARPTGAAHWETLLRARAIENGAFILAPAQTGHHGGTRKTHGHSLVVAPWGEVLLDAGTDAGVYFCEIDLSDVQKARARVPSLGHDRNFDGP